MSGQLRLIRKGEMNMITVAGKMVISFSDVLKGAELTKLLDFSMEDILSAKIELVLTDGNTHKVTLSEPSSIEIEEIESDVDEENKEIAKLQLDDRGIYTLS